MITFERSTDYHLIKKILTEPACYLRMRADNAPAPERFEVGPCSGLQYILARNDAGPAGVFIIAVTEQPGVAEIHFSIRKQCWFQSAPIARAFLQWVWRETSLNTLLGPVPGYNLLAKKMAEGVGFRESARVPNAVTRDGVNFDLIVMTLSRPAKDPGVSLRFISSFDGPSVVHTVERYDSSGVMDRQRESFVRTAK